MKIDLEPDVIRYLMKIVFRMDSRSASISDEAHNKLSKILFKLADSVGMGDWVEEFEGELRWNYQHDGAQQILAEEREEGSSSVKHSLAWEFAERHLRDKGIDLDEIEGEPCEASPLGNALLLQGQLCAIYKKEIDEKGLEAVGFDGENVYDAVLAEIDAFDKHSGSYAYLSM